MKKLVLASTLLVLTTTSFAATTGTLLLQGMVAQKMSLTVSAQAAASALDLSTSQTDLAVASVQEQSNSKTGYKVNIASANLGKLKRTDGSDVFSYTLKYNGSAVNLSSAIGATITNSTVGAANVNKDVTVSYTGIAPEQMVEGTYADTVTFSISAN